MSLWKIAWRSIQQRSLASTLTAISMGLGVMLVVAVLVLSSVVQKSFTSANSLGYNMIAGAKGGRLDLLLNTVFYLNRPIANIPWTFYQEFLPADQRPDHKNGQYAAYVDLAIPLCLGDFLGDQAQYRVVGTNSKFFTELLHSKFSSGEVFKDNDFATAVVGSEVADKLHLKVGGDVVPIHGGVGGEKHMPFRITGVLTRTGTPNDRAAFVNLEGFFLIPDHARGHVEEPKPPPGQPEPKEEMLKTPLPDKDREETAILLRGSSANGMLPELATIDLPKEINRGDIAQVILPVQEIQVLTGVFVRPIVSILLGLTVLIVIISGVSIMVSIYNSMSERRHEIAVMRALGARRSTVMLVVLFESILLALGGGVIGWFAGHLLVGAAGPFIEGYTGVASGVFEFAPIYELILIPALILLASLVGYLPALAAYRTDIGAALTATP
jgi:putative ABC transport system permease protein